VIFILLGKWTNHKGRSRRFTNPDELEEQRKREEQERRWKKNNRGDDEESSSEEEKPVTKGDKSNSEDESNSGSESDEDSDDVSFTLKVFSRVNYFTFVFIKYP